MKLLELEVRKFRGIVEIHLTPNGDNLLLLGPNGSGKSAVVDALDFLLTGNIGRLTGRGTGEITLPKHGRHVDHPIAEAHVRAIFQIPGVDQPVELKRRLEAPTNLLCDAAVLPIIEPVLDLAARRQHLLTRRELLDFIVSEPAIRAASLQTLLKLDDVSEVRSTLVRVANEMQRETRALQRARETALATVARTLGTATPTASELKAEVNRCRALLGGTPLETVTSETIKNGVAVPQTPPPGKVVDLALIRKDRDVVLEPVSEDALHAMESLNSELHALLNSFRTNPGLLRALQRKQLIDLGAGLLDDTGLCPLCDSRWDAVELREYLEGKQAAAATAAANSERVTALTSRLLSRIDRIYVSLEALIAVGSAIGAAEEADTLRTWAAQLAELRVALESPVDAYTEARFSSQRVAVLMAPSRLTEVVANLLSVAAKKSPEPTPEQKAWDQLTRLEENLRAGEHLAKQLKAAETAERRADALLSTFEAARDSVLDSLYEAVKDRFVELYRTVHSPDESSFEALLKSERAGIRFEVGFHGRGTHPPHALHSEGHQDSMGLCLFLALAEHLALDHIGFVILDDVLMSVDADHRHRVANLLASRMRGRQLIITTHDRAWANQLRFAGVATSKHVIEFRGWSIGAGPIASPEADVWAKIARDLEIGDAPSAAARLRRWAEDFFSNACDAFEARPVYRLNGRYELGDYFPAAVAGFRKLLADAKVAANSWNHRERVEALRAWDETFTNALKNTRSEEWAINAAVHYNSWANMTPADLEPVVGAFKALAESLSCSACGALTHLAYRGKTQVALTCPCGTVGFGLTEKRAK